MNGNKHNLLFYKISAIDVKVTILHIKWLDK